MDRELVRAPQEANNEQVHLEISRGCVEMQEGTSSSLEAKGLLLPHRLCVIRSAESVLTLVDSYCCLGAVTTKIAD